MGTWTLVAGVLCVAALAVSFIRWLSSARDVAAPATFAFGADRHMRCACPACKTLGKPRGAAAGVRAGFGPDGAPVSGRRRARASKLMGSFGERKRVAVIGAGAAGASAARQLAERGHSVVVFESAVDVGGRAFTLKQRGYHQFDTGAGFFTNFCTWLPCPPSATLWSWLCAAAGDTTLTTRYCHRSTVVALHQLVEHERAGAGAVTDQRAGRAGVGASLYAVTWLSAILLRHPVPVPDGEAAVSCPYTPQPRAVWSLCTRVGVRQWQRLVLLVCRAA